MNNYTFLCLDPKKTKRARLENLFAPVGKIKWLKIVGLSFARYPETKIRAKRALLQSKNLPRTKFVQFLKLHILSWQYNYTRKKLERENYHAAIVWNGLNGTRSVFSFAAKDAGIATIHCELSPFSGKITVDPTGVNYNNCLPRDIGPYMSWYKEHRSQELLQQTKATIKARRSNKTARSSDCVISMEEPFIFVPLQVPGDSQLRLFGRHFKSVPKLIKTLAELSHLIPDNWHIRIKEHPSAPRVLSDEDIRLLPKQIIIDNYNDTFEQVAKSSALITVNSSVGLEAMFYNKPVIALGFAFWAFGDLAYSCRSISQLRILLSEAENLAFNALEREAFLSFLLERYFVDETTPTAQIIERISGASTFLKTAFDVNVKHHKKLMGE